MIEEKTEASPALQSLSDVFETFASLPEEVRRVVIVVSRVVSRVVSEYLVE